jgi:hypothetical protein
MDVIEELTMRRFTGGSQRWYFLNSEIFRGSRNNKLCIKLISEYYKNR